MSLDLYIRSKTPVSHKGTGVYVRRNGETVELSPEEVKEQYPNTNIDVTEYTDDIYWHKNITHNLGKMASNVLTPNGITLYSLLWRPEETNLLTKDNCPTKSYIENVVAATTILGLHPEDYEKFNPENGWGSYKQLLKFCESYCKVLWDLSSLYKLNNYFIEADV